MKLLFLTILQALYKCSVDMASVVSDWLDSNRHLLSERETEEGES
jgi:hypothetical protein